jgi:ATP-dependent helicase/nuclease subunit A
MLTVYRASAGSGKTFQLVGEYLKLLLKNPLNYRHILAVTFTNKATNEMKSRILHQLYLLGNNKENLYMPLLKTELNINEENIRKRSAQVLKNILYDYSRFSISTIDSFTQRIIKAFNRETGLSPNFTLGLDDDLILDEAVDRLFSKIDTDKQLLKWLVEFSEEKITENKNQHLEEDIKSLGDELFREKFQIFVSGSNDEAFTRENLKSFQKKLKKITSDFTNVLKKRAGEAMEVIHQNGFSTDDFSYKTAGIGGYFKALSEGIIKEPKSRVTAAEESAETWFTKNHKRKELLLNLIENYLRPLLKEILAFYRENIIIYNSSTEALKQLRVLGILTDLKEEITNLLNEKGMLQLSYSNLLVTKIIGESDSPFIYEKIGNRYKYYMIDEFQDTSSLQWNNFKPLVFNSLSEGNPVLLVGDVKQSIYRWRNSDWNILASQINSDFPAYPPKEIELELNWRSRPNIIDFNNAIFSNLKKTFEDFLFSEFDREDYKIKFQKIYSNIFQKPGNPDRKSEGLISVNFPDKEDFETNSALLLVDQVKVLQDQGLKASDIAILIRKNREGAKIVETFLSAAKKPENAHYNLSVLSNESLFLYSSRAVNMVILVIELLIDKENEIQKVALLNLWFSWLKHLNNNPDNNSAGENQDSDKLKNDWQIGNDFETVFESELGWKMKKLKEKILLTSIDETLTEICAEFGLFNAESELPFLQTLIDQAAEIKSTISNDLSNFVLWWYEKGYNTSVTVNEEVDSVRLLTIHKSKGLEFEAVLIPFLNWETSRSGTLAPLLWCRPSLYPFDMLPLLPVRSSKKLINTIFREDYFEEQVNYITETLNLVYVAFTRARSVLFINCKNRTKDDDGIPGNSVNELLWHSLNNLASEKQYASAWNETKTCFSYGVMPNFRGVQQQEQVVKINRYYYSNYENRISLRNNSDDFLINDNNNRSVKNTGKIVHEILSGIETAQDIETACIKALKEGKISESESEEIKKKLTESLANPLIGKWFDGSYKILNERNLITPEKILRPDRLMISGKRAVIADYKLGEKIRDKHHRQIAKYAGILIEYGFEEVEGYIWYINYDEIEKVALWKR